MKRILCTLFAAVLLLGGAVTAKADPITSWGTSISGVFSSYTFEDNSNWFTLDDGRDLSWGPGNAVTNYDNRSGIVLSENLITFRNNALAGYGSLTGGTIDLTLNFYANGDTANAVTLSTVLNFGFKETPNDGMPGYDADIFFFFDPAAAEGEFTYKGYDYLYSFMSSFLDLTAYPDFWLYVWEPNMGENPDAFGWLIGENATTAFQFGLDVSRAPTPEPGTMLLMGAGLAGLALCVRRRRK